MTITRKEFEDYDVNLEIQRLGVNEVKIMNLLYSNNTQAYNTTEIQKETGIKFQAAVSLSLKSLLKKEFVDCKVCKGKKYWRSVNGECEEDFLRICSQYKKASD